MKKGRELNDMITEMEILEKEKRDFLVSAKNMSISNDAQEICWEDSNGYRMSDLFHKQMANMLNIPGRYYDRCLYHQPQLLADNVNTWLKENNKEYMVRTLGNKSRALLSNKYKRIDNLSLTKAILPVIEKEKDWKVVSSEMTEEQFYIKIANPAKKTDVVPGDTVMAGAAIFNSEVGLKRVTIVPYFVRLVCTNGMTGTYWGEGFSRRHLGKTVTLSELETLEDPIFLSTIEDAMKKAICSANLEMAARTMAEAAHREAECDILKLVENVGKQLSLTKEEIDGVYTHFIADDDLSQWGLANAFTRYSQDIISYDRATDFESFGEKIILMDEGHWKELNLTSKAA